MGGTGVSVLTRWNSPAERFDLQVEKTDGCWHWKGSRNDAGYGLIGIDGRTEYAHRYAYREFVGPIADGLVVDHLCSEPSCVNPAHLETVPQAANVRRGRLTTLTEAQASAIRGATGTQTEIAAKFGVSQPMVSMIKSGKRWAKEAS
ncbi:MAG: hypothetical protein E6Q97_23300 [Desulfurellales bacterium]|nr:MAG: hypothetical protein E6Q97_23300 [Desulfurellales bacterium]